MNFKIWLENQNKYNVNRLPLILQGLAAEAIKSGSFEEFEKDFHHQIKHGLYWHWTYDPNFRINPAMGPRDRSSIGSSNISIGNLMIASDINAWSEERPYAALIDMTEVPRNAYKQVNRGFGNEFFVSDTNNAKVIKILPRKEAFAKNRQQRQYLPSNQENLQAFYDSVVDFYQKRQAESPILPSSHTQVAHPTQEYEPHS